MAEVDYEASYEINFRISFWSGDSSETNYPGEDKVWFDTWLDRRVERKSVNSWWLETVDCWGFELPIEFLAWPKDKREEKLPELLNKSVEIAADLLVRNNIDDYAVNSFVDVMDIDWEH